MNTRRIERVMKQGRMKIPEEVKKFAAGFYQGISEEYETLEEIAHEAAQFIDKCEREVVKALLDELLTGEYDEADFRSIWRKTGASLHPIPGRRRGRRFLTALRSALD